jgi:hypothetical protein
MDEEPKEDQIERQATELAHDAAGNLVRGVFHEVLIFVGMS